MSNDKEVRRTITFPNQETHDKLSEWAKRHKITQGEVIETLLNDMIDEDKMMECMDARRQQKVAGRTSIRALIQQTKGLSVAEREALLKKRGLK